MEFDPKMIENTWAQFERLLRFLQERDGNFYLRVQMTLARTVQSETGPASEPAPVRAIFERAPNRLLH
jgi:hypothetical protein